MLLLFYIVQIPFIYVLPGNVQYSTLFNRSGVIEKAIPSTVWYGISWNSESDATNNCTNPHMSISHQSNQY